MATGNAINANSSGLVRYNGTGTFDSVTTTQYNALVGAASNGITSVAPSATSGVPLISQGAAADPIFGTALIAGGGTAAVSFNINGAVYSNTTSTGALQSATLTSGQLLIGGTTVPAAGTLTPGTGVSITNGNQSITINATGGGITWTDVTGTSQAMAVNNGYTADNVGLVTATLPVTAAYGTIMEVSGVGAGGWKIAQNANQIIHFGSATTTTGATGFLASTLQRDCVKLLCVVADLEWNVLSSVGNLTVN